jgi:hypothetical protein
MLKAILFLSACATALAADNLVTEYYTDSACTNKNWGFYQSFSTPLGCSNMGGSKPSTLTKKVNGGYNATVYAYSSDCTGAIYGTPTFTAVDTSCTAQAGSDGYKKKAWKASVPVTAAEIPKGHVAVIYFEGADCDTAVNHGSYRKLGACDTARIHYAKAGIYSISTTDSTEVMYAFNCTLPETPSYLSFKTTCTDDKGEFYQGIIGTKEEGDTGDTLSGGKLASSFQCVVLASTLASMLLFL